MDDFELAAESDESLDEELPMPPAADATEEEAPPPAAQDSSEEERPQEPWRGYVQEGETPEQALQRIAKEKEHEAGRARAHYSELKDYKERLAGLERENQAATRLYEHFQRLEEKRAREALEAEQPDPELEPEKVLINEVRALRERILAQEARQRQDKEQQTLTAEQERIAQQWKEVDNWNEQEIAKALGQVDGAEPDPEFKEAFDTVERYTWNVLSQRYPDATEDEKLEAMSRLRMISGRQTASQGKSILQAYRESAAAIRQAIGQAQPQQGANGKPRTPTTQDVERESKRRAQGGGIQRRSGKSSVSPPPNLADFAAMSEEEQARLIEQSEISEEELWAGLADDSFGG